MRLSLIIARLPEIVKYYQAGIVNALFGFGVYALLVWFGLNPYLAQILATVIGATFNYFTYSQHVFKEAAPAKGRFAVSYVLNYLVSVAALFVIGKFVRSPYIAGAFAIGFTSIINYFALKYAVFNKKATQ